MSEQIVRALAAENPAEGKLDPEDYDTCFMCGVVFDEEAAGSIDDLAAHAPDCLWRLAREWVAAQ